MRVDLPKGIGLDSIMCALTVEIAKAQAKSTTFVVDINFFFLNCSSCRSSLKSLTV